MKYLLKKFSTSFLFVFEIHCTSKFFQCFSVDFQESDYMVYSYVIFRKVSLKVILIIEIHISDTRVNSLMIAIYVFLNKCVLVLKMLSFLPLEYIFLRNLPIKHKHNLEKLLQQNNKPMSREEPTPLKKFLKKNEAPIAKAQLLL